MSLDLTTVKTIYRQAIDECAQDAEGEAWWAEVAAEIQAVIAAPSAAAASAIIVWWHNDWSAVSDSAKDAARRLRAAAAQTLRQH